MTNQNKLVHKNEQGQMVILVLLVLVIALTVGLSLVARTTTNTKLSTNTELSNRAYSAAEAGIEEALRLSTTGTPTSQTADIGKANYNYVTTTQGNSSTIFAYPNPVSINESVQTWLFNYNVLKSTNALPTAASDYYNNTTNCASCVVTVYWGTGSNAAVPNPSSTTPAIEISLVYVDGSGNFGNEKYAIDPSQFRRPTNGFDTEDVGSAPYTLTTNQGTKKYYYKKQITLQAYSSRKYLLMRSKLLYNSDAKHEIAIDPQGATLPPQGQVIESTGTAGDVVRKIRVFQSYPSLPGIFDFVVYNGSATTPLQKN